MANCVATGQLLCAGATFGEHSSTTNGEDGDTNGGGELLEGGLDLSTTADARRKKKKPYKELTLEEKVELIRLAERCSNLSQASIAERYEIAKSNVCRILQRKEEYIRALESAGFAGSRKRKLRTAGMENGAAVDKGAKEEERAPTQAQGGEALRQGDEPAQQVLMGEETRDNDALRAHMSREHQLGRVFLCRCCNWAFRDKNALHQHLKSRKCDERTDKEEEEADNNSLSQCHNDAQQQVHSSSECPNLEMPLGNNSANCAVPASLVPGGDEQRTMLVANLWSSLLLGQQSRLCNLVNGQTATAPGNQFAHHIVAALPAPNSTAVCPIVPQMAVPQPGSVIVQNSSSNTSSSCAPSTSSSLSSSSVLAQQGHSSPSDSDSEVSSSHHSQTISPPSRSQNSVDSGGGGHLVHAECVQCAALKHRLALSQTRCAYLETTGNITFQNELLRLNAKCLLAEQCIRRLELELRQWRERNDLLRYRLLECREKTLAMVQQSSAMDLSKFVGEVLKITLV